MLYTFPFSEHPVRFAVRFNNHVLGEFQAILETAVDPTEEPELHEVQVAVDNAQVVVRRKSGSTYEALLTLSAVEAFAREVAYYLEHALDCRSECTGDRYGYAELTKVVNGCRTALESANEVLAQAGLPAIHSYFQK